MILVYIRCVDKQELDVIISFLYLYPLLFIKRMHTPLMHKLFLGELHIIIQVKKSCAYPFE